MSAFGPTVVDLARLGEEACDAGAPVLVTAVTLAPRPGFAQGLVLSADVGKAEFFEDEPIYLLVQLKNVAPDTAWLTPFGLLSEAVSVSVRRQDGQPVLLGGPIAHYVAGPQWRGEPLPPGKNLLSTQELQVRAGEDRDYRRYLLPNHLSTGFYEVRVQFAAHAGVPDASPLTVDAPPIAFRIRERTAAEENELQELERIRSMGWDRAQAAQYPTAVIAWAERRVREEPTGPFLPFMLSGALYGVGQFAANEVGFRFVPDTSAAVRRLRLAVIEAQGSLPAGAHLAGVAFPDHPEALPALATRLGQTLAGAMVRYRMEHIPYGQRAKKAH